MWIALGAGTLVLILAAGGAAILAYAALSKSTTMQQAASQGQDVERPLPKSGEGSASAEPKRASTADSATTQRADQDAQRLAAVEKERQELAARQRADELRRQQEAARDEGRKARRQQIKAQLDALPESERREREALEKAIALYQSDILQTQQAMETLQSDIQSLRLDAQLGRAFGMPRAKVGTPREKVLQAKIEAYKEYDKSLAETKATFSRDENNLRELPVRYDRERNRLLQELLDK